MSNAQPPRIFSPHRRAAHWERALVRQQEQGAARYLLDDAVDDIIDRIGFMRLEPRTALVSGDWSGRLAAQLAATGCSVRQVNPLSFDEEMPYASGGYDLVIHCLGLGMVNDLPGALIHSRHALADGGIMIASFPGAGSVMQLRQIMQAADAERPSARIHPMVDTSAAASLLQRAGFQRQVVDSHVISVRYSSFGQLVSDLRDHGLSNALRDLPQPLGKRGLDLAKDAFTTRADSEGKLLERFEMLTLTGWK